MKGADRHSSPADQALAPAPAPPLAVADPGCAVPRIVALDELLQRLRECFARDARGAGAAELLRGYAGHGSDWREFAFFEDDAYTRNLLERNAEFELLLLCWSPGQSSPIHNHEGQNCWAAVMQGPLEEVRYRLPAESRPGPPLELETQRYAQGEVMFIRDDIALHAVRATGSARATSLHLYARPYAWCNLYCEATGKVTRTRLADYSVRGHRVPR